MARDGVRYQRVRGAKSRDFEQNGGVIAAVDEATEKELWTLVVYQTKYDPDEEQDVQDVYITSLKISDDGKQLLIENERGRRFTVHLADRSVRETTAAP